jgi:hypothetical protein
MPQNNPPFRADVAGSLLRPQFLIDARGSYRERAVERGALIQIEDMAIRDGVALQEADGLNVVTDGEFRRQNYLIDFYFKVFGRGGLAFEPGLFFHRNDKGDKLPAERMVVKAIRSTVILDNERPRSGAPAREIGADTRQVLVHDGFSETEIADLLEAGAARAPQSGARELG